MERHCMLRAALALLAWGLLFPLRAEAHCDGIDGPVVKAAQRALESEDLKPVLIWVQQESEAEITAAFDKTLAVRKLGLEARELADRYFFETLVRLHRAGEGEPYTGLKPAGRDLGPAVPAADRAIESGSAEQVVDLVASAVRQGIQRRFDSAAAAKARAADDPDNVEKGRHFVAAYVAFLHHVERLYESAASSPGHAQQPAEAARSGHDGHGS